jgi:hypothetical protein
MMNLRGLEGCGRGLILGYYPCMFSGGLRYTTKTLSQGSRFPGPDLNPERPEYEAGVLTTRPRHSVK